MPTYRVTAPDGTTYNVTPPEGANVSQEDILGAVMQHHQDRPITGQEYNDATAANLAGLGFGVGDEVLAGLGSVFRPDLGGYDKQLSYLRGAQDRMARQKGGVSLATNLIGGAPLAVAGAGPVAGMVGKALPSLGKVGQAAVTGGIFGGAAGFGSGEGGIENRLASAALGTGMGAGLGAAVEGVIAPVASRLVQAFAGRPQFLDPKTGSLTPQGMKFVAEYAQKNGIDPQQLGAAFEQELAKQAQGAGRAMAVNPEQAGALAEANSLPVKVPMTKGQLTGDPQQQLFESQSAKGVYGSGAQAKVGALYDATDQALRDNQDVIRQKIIGSTANSEPGQRGQLVQSALNTLKSDASAEVKSLYDAAKQGGDAAIAGDKYREAVQNIIGDVANDFHPDHAPLVFSMLNKMQQAANKAGDAETLISTVFRNRRHLVSLQGGGGTEGAAAGAAKKALDEYLINTIDDAALSGDKTAIQKWKDAISAFRDYKGKFEGGDLVEKLVSTDQFSKTLSLDPESAINVIFGRSNSGFVSKTNIGRDLGKIKELLGEDSDAWKALKEEAFLRFMRTAQGATRPTERAFSGANLSKAWNSAMETNPEVMRQIFTNEERALISQFTRVAQRVTTVVPGGANNSDTSGAIVQFMRKMLGSAIVGPKVAAFFEGTPVLKGLTQLPDEMRAASSVVPKADVMPIPARDIRSNNPQLYNALSVMGSEMAGRR